MRLFGRSIVIPAVAGTPAHYTDDLLTGGTPSANSEYSPTYVASKACDNDETTTCWATTNPSPFPNWWKYDFGAGITKTITKLRIKAYYDESGGSVKDFKLQGSNNDTDWTDIYIGQHANDGNWETYTFSNSVAYRYYRVYLTSNYRALAYNAVWEFEMMEYVEAVPGVAAVEGLVSLPLVFGWYDNFFVEISQSNVPSGYGYKVSSLVPAGELWVCTAAYYYFDTAGTVGYLAIEMNSGQTNHMAGQNDLVLGRFYFWNGFRTLPPDSEFCIEWSGVSGSPHIVGRFSGYKMKLE